MRQTQCVWTVQTISCGFYEELNGHITYNHAQKYTYLKLHILFSKILQNGILHIEINQLMKQEVEILVLTQT
jgi:hypothetical protein